MHQTPASGDWAPAARPQSVPLGCWDTSSCGPSEVCARQEDLPLVLSSVNISHRRRCRWARRSASRRPQNLAVSPGISHVPKVAETSVLILMYPSPEGLESLGFRAFRALSICKYHALENIQMESQKPRCFSRGRVAGPLGPLSLHQAGGL